MLIQMIWDIKNGSNEQMLLMITRFQPLISKYSHYLGYEDAESELIYFFICFVKKFDVEKMHDVDDATIVGYIHVSIKNEYNRLLKQKIKERKIICISQLDENEQYYIDIGTAIEDEIGEMKDIMDKVLTEREKNIIKLIYYDGISVKEIADMQKRTRQAVNQEKKRALCKLRRCM